MILSGEENGANAMLNELFSWLLNHETSLDIENVILTQAELEREQALASEQQRRLIAHFRSLKFTPSSDPQAISIASHKLANHEHFMRMLRVFEQNIDTELGAQSLYQLTLEYLLSADHKEDLEAILDDKAIVLFDAFLNQDQEKALEYFRKIEFNLPLHMHLALSTAITKWYLQNLSKQLRHEEKPFSIATLFKTYVSHPEQLAASLLWLLQKEIDVSDILKTGLLQHFLLYNLADLHSSDSPVVYFYQLLQQFPETRPLISAAERIRCEDPAFNHYSLIGEMHNEIELEGIEVCEQAFDFTLQNENMTALYQVFGIVFLGELLRWQEKEQETICAEFLHNILNHELSLNDLSSLIKVLAADENPKQLKHLAFYVEEATLQKLLSKIDGSAFLLLPFKSEFRYKIRAQDVENYLKHLKGRNQGYELIGQLMALYHTFRGIKPEIASLPYEVVVDLLIEQPHFLDDESLRTQLAKFHQKESIITRKFEQLSEQLNQTIIEQTSVLSLSTPHYHAVEDTWFEVSRKMAVLRDISILPASFPRDKYALQGHFAKAAFSKHPALKLMDFFHILEIEPEFDANGVNEYERVAIEILTNSDNQRVRDELLQGFLHKYGRHKHWVSQKYGSEDVFLRAVNNGNLSFLSWLIEHKLEPDRHQLGCIVSQAARKRQWDVVAFFCRIASAKLDRGVLKEIFLAATEFNDLPMMRLVRDMAIARFDRHVVEQAFLIAVRNGHAQAANLLCHSGPKSPCKPILVKGLKMALKAHDSDMVCMFDSIMTDQHKDIERLIQHSTTHNKPRELELLLNFKKNAARLCALETGLQTACQRGHVEIAIQLLSISEASPGLNVVEKSLLSAAKCGYLEIVKLLMNLETKPRDRAVQAARHKAHNAGNEDVAAFLKRPYAPKVSVPESHDLSASFLSSPSAQSRPKSTREANPLARVGLFGVKSPVRRSESCFELSSLNVSQ